MMESTRCEVADWQCSGLLTRERKLYVGSSPTLTAQSGGAGLIPALCRCAGFGLAQRIERLDQEGC